MTYQPPVNTINNYLPIDMYPCAFREINKKP
jgi:hypothetical protein